MKTNRDTSDLAYFMLIMGLLLLFVVSALCKPKDLHMRVETEQSLLYQWDKTHTAKVWYDLWLDKEEGVKLDPMFKAKVSGKEAGMNWYIGIGFEL